MEKTLPRRDEVPQADRWAVETVFPSEKAFDQAYARAEARIAPLADLSGTLGASGGQLLAALEARQSVDVEVSRIRLYAMMQSSGDETNQANGARRERAGALVTRFEATVAYVEPEILAIPTDTLEQFLSEEPGLAPFRHYLDGVVRMRGHVRSAEVESLLAQAGDALASSWQTHEALENADLRFATIADEDGSAVELAQGNSDQLIESAHRVPCAGRRGRPTPTAT